MIPVNKNIVKDEIQWLLEAIQEQYDAIKSYEGRIPQIEFDIIMENVRKIYEKLHMLQRSEDPFSNLEEKMRDTPVITPMVPVMDREEVIRDPKEVPVPDTGIKMRMLSTEDIGIPQPVTPGNESPAAGNPTPVLPGDGDLFAGSDNSFGEKLMEAREKGIGADIHRERPHDLKSAITINEKFLMINELFEGNLRDYNETIETFNGFRDIHVAMEYLDLLRKKNLWDSGSKVFQRLKDLLESRFNI